MASFVEWERLNYAVGGDAAAVRVDARRSGDLSLPVQIAYATADDGAADRPYVPATGTISFAAGETRQTAVIQLLPEKAPAGGRSFRVELTSTDPNAAIKGPTACTVAIKARSPFAFLAGDHPVAFGLRMMAVALLLLVGTGFVAALAYRYAEAKTELARTHFLSVASDTYCKATSEHPAGAVSPRAVASAAKAAPAGSASQDGAGTVPTATLARAVPGLETVTSGKGLSPADRLMEQAGETQRRICLHAGMFKMYVSNYYMAVLTAMITGAIAGVTLLLISRAGWEKANAYVVTVFLTMGAVSIFFTAFPSVFLQEQMSTAHKGLLIKYTSLKDEIASYIATGEGLVRPKPAVRTIPASTGASRPVAGGTGDASPAEAAGGAALSEQPQASASPASQTSQASKYGVKMSLAEFIHYVDQQLADGDLPFSLDLNKLPSYSTLIPN